MLRGLRHSVRLLGIARTLARHDALFLFQRLGLAPYLMRLAAVGAGGGRVEGRPGQRLAAALSSLGPSFIKLGQALATRADLLGEEMAEDLSELQDRLPPFAFDKVRRTIEAEFGEPLENLFPVFDETPVAAASIAQVHFAETPDGQPVAVKVLRPGIEAAFARDVDLFLWVAQWVERVRPEMKRLKPTASVETLAETVVMEMDLRFEAAAAAELAENFAGDPWFRVPAIDWSRTGRRVLTTERLSGLRIDDREALLKAGHDPMEILTRAASASFLQVFRDGFFHADTHPGNMFVLDDGAIGVVDFGIMGRLDLRTRRWIAEMLIAFLSRDFRRAAEIHFEAGWVPRDRSLDAFTQACRSIAEPILDKPQNEISLARLLAQLFQITETFRMETQPQLLLLQKTMVVAEGTSRKLAPEANMWLLARPLIEDWVRENLGPEARIRAAARDAADTFERLPRLIDNLEEASRQINEGRLQLAPETVRALLASERGSGSMIGPIRLWAVIFVLAVGLVLAALG